MSLTDLLPNIKEGRMIFVQWPDETCQTVQDISHNIVLLSGYDKSEFISGKIHFPALLHPKDEAQFIAELNHALDNQLSEFSHSTYRLKHKNGEDRYVYGHNLIIRNESGDLEGIQTYLIDITQDHKEQLNERRLKEAQQLAQIGSWELDLVENSLFWSDEVFRIFDMDPQRFEASYEAFVEAIHPEDRDMVNAAYLNSLETKQAYQIKHRLLMPDGSIKFVQERCNTYYDQEGQPLKSIGTVQDITEQAIMEEKLRISEERYLIAVNGLDDGLWDWDPKTNEFYMSPRWKEMLGYQDNELTNSYENYKSLMAPEFVEPTVTLARQLIEGIIPKFEAEIKMRHKDGHWVDILSRASLQRDAEGNPLRVVGTHIDISSRKLVEENLRNAKEAAEEATQEKSDFLANMSHEIRTPMNSIIGMSDLILSTELDSEQLLYAMNIKNSSESLLSIINDILDFSKLEASKLELEEIPFDLCELVTTFAQSIAVQAHNKGLELICPTNPVSHVSCIGDPSRIRQILANLVGNAIKFTKQGMVSVDISCSSYDDEHDMLRFEVKDTGIGLTEEQSKRLFKRFSQGDSSTTRSYGGTGLGLTISQQLATHMGGDIGYHSNEGQGCTFWFTVKVKKSTSAQPFKFDTDLAAKKALIADDNPIHRRYLEQLLNGWGVGHIDLCECSEARSFIQKANSANTSYDVCLYVQPANEKQYDTRFDEQVTILITPRKERMHGAPGLQRDRMVELSKPFAPLELYKQLHEVMGLSSITLPRNASNRRLSDAQFQGKVLVVDDNQVNRLVAKGLLTKMGLELAFANDGQAAVDLLSEEQFDLVLMDLQMPGMDGFQATTIIRDPSSSVLEHDVPILAVSANVRQDDINNCFSVGMNGFVSKPIAIGKLKAQLGQWLPSAPSKERD